MLIAATLGHLSRDLGVKNASLQVRESDAGTKLHGIYTSCGFVGPEGAEKSGGIYLLSNIPTNIEE